MAKIAPKPAAKTAAAPSPAPKAEAKEEKVPLAKMRGPRGVKEDAVITVLVEENPKRPNSKAHAVFACYESGQTVGDFCDAAKEIGHADYATPCMVYDAKHGFIEIEGYEVPGGVTPKEPKAKKEPKAAKEAKEPKGKPVAKGKAKKDEEAEEETVD